MIKSTTRSTVLAAFGVKERLAGCRGPLLTFDDGPDPVVTPAVLDLLAEYNARAVFFLVGNRIARAPHMVDRIRAEGHLIGNHSFLHPLDRTPALVEYYRDVNQCQNALESMTGQRPRWFRPPLGSITFASLVAPRLCGLRTLLWSVDVDDWALRQNDEAVQAGNRLAHSATAGDVVLLHDDNPCVVTVLETAMAKFRNSRFDLADAASRLAGD